MTNINYKEGLGFDDVLLKPNYSSIVTRKDVDLSTSICNGNKPKLKMPILSANMINVTTHEMALAMYHEGGLGVIHRFMTVEKQKEEVMQSVAHPAMGAVAAAVGVVGDYYERAKMLHDVGCNIIVVDIAHGNSKLAIDAIKKIRRIDTPKNLAIMAGNVGDGEGVRNLVLAGADVIKVGIGSGCLVAGTRILMANGTYKNIENIVPGERVINKEGTPVTVINAFSTGIKEVYKLRHPLFYEDTYVTTNHEYFVGDLNNISYETLQSGKTAFLLERQNKTTPRISKFRWKEIGQLKQDVLLSPKNINFELMNTFSIKLQKRVGGNWRTGSRSQVDTILMPNYELGYLFGTFLGDGCSHVAIHNNSHIGAVSWYFASYENNIMEKLSLCLKTLFGKEPKQYKKKNMGIITFYYKPLADFLQEFGKKQNKHLPSKYLVNDKDYLQGIYDGLVDSDGCIDTMGRVYFTSTSKFLMELFGIVCYLTKGILPHYTKIGIRSSEKVRGIHVAYKASISLSAFQQLTKDYHLSRILECSNSSSFERVYDLEIDCPTHSFIANNVVVHNSICTTRLVTGSGVPQITAIDECSKMANRLMEYQGYKKIPIIADGGIKNSGDIVKALAAGADAVMIGELLAGTDESPGTVFMSEGRKKKLYVGSSSAQARAERQLNNSMDIEQDMLDYVPEGREAVVDYTGSVHEVITHLTGGIRSGFSYLGVKSIDELHTKPITFYKIQKGIKESRPLDITFL